MRPSTLTAVGFASVLLGSQMVLGEQLACQPGELRTDSTPNCISIEWDVTGDSDVNVTTTGGLRLSAGMGIGLLTGNTRAEPVNSIETSVGAMSGRSGVDGMNLLESESAMVDDVEVTIQRVQADASLEPLLDDLQSDLVTSGNGSIVLRSLDGDITLNDGTAPSDGDSVRADGSGRVEQAYTVSYRVTDEVANVTRLVDVQVTWDEPDRPNRAYTLSSIRYNREGL